VGGEFDQLAGSAGGMTGGPPRFLRISSQFRRHPELRTRNIAVPFTYHNSVL
jgi:hypothetical protein